MQCPSMRGSVTKSALQLKMPERKLDLLDDDNGRIRYTLLIRRRRVHVIRNGRVWLTILLSRNAHCVLYQPCGSGIRICPYLVHCTQDDIALKESETFNLGILEARLGERHTGHNRGTRDRV